MLLGPKRVKNKMPSVLDQYPADADPSQRTRLCPTSQHCKNAEGQPNHLCLDALENTCVSAMAKIKDTRTVTC